MARRVILDTGVLIAIERGVLDIRAALGADDACIATIAAMELLVGVERADEQDRAARAAHVEALLSGPKSSPPPDRSGGHRLALAADALADVYPEGRRARPLARGAG